uniref:Pentatricopeptide repeat-containing protein At2g22410, mitochondrial-like n=1 Tax=Nicotiana tabacum TaxID=4097 RepID=A0A1S3ZH91_TOBAC|nr:PREDICTED: pentatricopeptide repeat-containing protein At2g22410, mitochondrial-like [Nicotiana tabacum]
MYASFGLSNDIMILFDEIPEPDIVSWNVLIDNLGQNGFFYEVLGAVNEMCRYGVEPNSVTLLGLVSSCLKTGDFGIGKLIHLYVIKKGIHISENLENGLIDMYAKFGDMESADKLFNRMQIKTVVTWTSLLVGFIQKGELAKASVIFNHMPKDITAYNVMLNGYAEARDMSSAEMIFRAMPNRDLVSWNTMIVGYTQSKKYMKSLELLREMLWFGLKPDRITLVGLFSVCGYAGVLRIGEAVHSFVEKQNIKEEEVEVALLDMYSKCGDPEKALRVFETIPRKSVLAWTNMIVGVAMNGLANEALMLFNQMCDEGIKPNEITFLGVLCGCSYAGLVKEGKWLFNAMSQVHGITPRFEHYGCMVDLLGRAGLLKEAEMFIQDMPEKADAGIWGALLGACKMHGEVQLGEKIAKIVTQMDPYHSGRYILLSNIYAAENRWIDAEKWTCFSSQRSIMYRPHIFRPNLPPKGLQTEPNLAAKDREVFAHGGNNPTGCQDPHGGHTLPARTHAAQLGRTPASQDNHGGNYLPAKACVTQLGRIIACLGNHGGNYLPARIEAQQLDRTIGTWAANTIMEIT